VELQAAESPVAPHTYRRASMLVRRTAQFLDTLAEHLIVGHCASHR
jgi:hypothetical protein